jgi:S-DNA-T family DNA segregation ATPase FtsK/SpoIIIE
MMILEIAGICVCAYTMDKLWDRDRREAKRKWRMIMKGSGIQNKLEQTYEVLKVLKKKYGFDLIISLPKGLSYEKLEEKLPEIETGLSSIVEMEWKRFNDCAYLRVAVEDYDSAKRFKPVETKGVFELYFGETYFFENLTADMREYPHVLTAGSTGTGKSRCLFIALTNLLYQYDNVDLFLAQVSDKKDLQKFAYYRQTKYFAKNLQTTDQMIKYLLDMQKERNRLLNQYNLNNIDEYNKRFPDKKLNYVYVVFDEFASLTPGEKDTDPYYHIKKRIIFNLNELARQARSAGEFIIASLQRPDKTNLDPNLKNLFNVKVAFRANNIASSKVLVDDDAAFNLPNREALFISSNYKTLKTPYIDDKIITSLLQNKYEANHKYVEIFPKESEEPKAESQSNVTPIKPKKSKGVVKKC